MEENVHDSRDSGETVEIICACTISVIGSCLGVYSGCEDRQRAFGNDQTVFVLIRDCVVPIAQIVVARWTKTFMRHVGIIGNGATLASELLLGLGLVRVDGPCIGVEIPQNILAILDTSIGSSWQRDRGTRQIP